MDISHGADHVHEKSIGAKSATASSGIPTAPQMMAQSMSVPPIIPGAAVNAATVMTAAAAIIPGVRSTPKTEAAKYVYTPTHTAEPARIRTDTSGRMRSTAAGLMISRMRSMRGAR